MVITAQIGENGKSSLMKQPFELFLGGTQPSKNGVLQAKVLQKVVQLKQ